MKKLNLLWVVLVASCTGILGPSLTEEIESYYSVKPIGQKYTYYYTNYDTSVEQMLERRSSGATSWGASHLAHYIEFPTQRLVSQIVIACKEKVSGVDIYVRVGITNVSEDWKLVKSISKSFDQPTRVLISQTCDLIRVVEKTNKQRRYKGRRTRDGLGDGLERWSSIERIQAFGPAVKIDSDVSDKEMDTSSSEDELEILLKQ